MTLQVTGKNIDAGDAFKTYISDKLKTALGKYIGEEKLAGHIRLEKERGRFHTQCSIKLRSGLALEANGEGGDAYASADSAVEKLEKRVRRHKRRLKDHHSSRNGAREIPETLAGHFTVRMDEGGEDEGGDHPIIIAESEKGIGELAVSEAVMQLDLTDKQFLVFRNASHGGINVVYRRGDGHIGWIDPSAATAKLNGATVMES